MLFCVADNSNACIKKQCSRHCQMTKVYIFAKLAYINKLQVDKLYENNVPIRMKNMHSITHTALKSACKLVCTTVIIIVTDYQVNCTIFMYG